MFTLEEREGEGEWRVAVMLLSSSHLAKGKMEGGGCLHSSDSRYVVLHT